MDGHAVHVRNGPGDKYGLGTYNLNDIASMWFPKKVTARTENGVEMTDWSVDGVNLVVQTGGARKWHGLEPDEDGRTLGLDIPTDRLSRYAVDFVDTPQAYGFVPAFTLVDEQPLASMSAPARAQLLRGQRRGIHEQLKGVRNAQMTAGINLPRQYGYRSCEF